MPDLKKTYAETIRPALMKEFGWSNPMQAPRVTKIVVNIGVGRESADNPKVVDNAVDQLTQIVGQKPVVTKAKKSIAGFKLREDRPIGVKVTLRGKRMFDFLYRLINLALPRVRDFRGIPADAFDGRGNYTLGLREQIIFPEIDYDKIDKVRGMEITIVTTADTDDVGRALLREFGMPFAKLGNN
ncbi:MAG: 50S ribosomal protein L5 [Chloroflexi bacterium]|nr:50S ribosomal protein L5 [Chloroflexota bacterium]